MVGRLSVVRILGVTLAVVMLLAFASASVAQDEVSFSHPWAPFISLNVLPAERGLWDDAPAASPAGEAGLLWFVNNQVLDETVGYASTMNIATTPFNTLKVKAAVSDHGLFRVGVALNSATTACQYPAALSWSAAEANGLYRVKGLVLPANQSLRKICILLSDDPNGVNVGRSTALIDYIRVTSAAGALGWEEQFTGVP